MRRIEIVIFDILVKEQPFVVFRNETSLPKLFIFSICPDNWIGILIVSINKKTASGTNRSSLKYPGDEGW